MSLDSDDSIAQALTLLHSGSRDYVRVSALCHPIVGKGGYELLMYTVGEGGAMRQRWVVASLVLLVLGIRLAPAAQMPMPGGDIPIEFIRVKQLVQLLSDGAKVVIVDVRSRQDYLIRHIKGALSIPLDSLEARAREIPRDGLVVLY